MHILHKFCFAFGTYTHCFTNVYPFYVSMTVKLLLFQVKRKKLMFRKSGASFSTLEIKINLLKKKINMYKL